MAQTRSAQAVSTNKRTILLVRVSVVLVIAGLFLYYICSSLHWPLMTDSPVMHYVNFLMQHGLKPYSEITDNNLPGSYMTEGLAMNVFGTSDLAWRVYEFCLLSALAGAMAVIARPYDWLAGVFAAGFFIMMHAADGPFVAVEREEIILVLLMIGYAAMFTAVRTSRPEWMLLFGLAGGLATSIKPTFGLLPVALLFWAAVELRKRGLSSLRYTTYCIAGFLAIAALIIGFLVHHEALDSFFYVLKNVTPTYVGYARKSILSLLALSIQKCVVILVPFGVLAAVMNRIHRRGWGWEQQSLAMGAAVAFLSYLLQGKGFVHHRYVFEGCLLLLMALEFRVALEWPGISRETSVLAIALAFLVAFPSYALRLHRVAGNSDLTLRLEKDLSDLGGERDLQRQVMCLDMVSGCLNALYHLQIVENTGFTGDMGLYVTQDSPGIEHYRNLFWALQKKDPATVFVMTNEDFLRSNSYDRVNRNPRFAEYLQTNYTQVVQRTFPMEGRTRPDPPDLENAPGYRIYIRNGSPFMSKVALLEGAGR